MPWLLLLLVVLGLAARLTFVFQSTWLEADPAVMGLIAKHIAEGKEFPAYLWLAHYSGTISAYITAVWFKVFGVSAVVYQITGFLFSCSYALLVWVLTRRLSGRPASSFALTLALLPPYQNFSYTMWYQYGDTLTMGCLALILLARLADAPDEDLTAAAGGLGLISGLGLWTSPMFAPFILTQGIILGAGPRGPAWRRRLGSWSLGFVVGYLPAIVYNLRHPGAQFDRMASRALDVGREEWTGSHAKVRLLLGKLLLKAVRGPAVVARIPSQFAEHANWLDVAALTAAGAAAWRRRLWARGVGARVVPVYLACFLLFHVVAVAESRGRFMFPLYLPFMILVAQGLDEVWRESRLAARLILSLMLAAHAASLARGLARPPRVSVKELNAFLRSHGINAGYSDYWIAYPAIFDAREEILISPTLFQPTFADRSPAYTAVVRRAPRAALILDRERNSCAEAPLEQRLRSLGVRYAKAAVNELDVYYDLARAVRPEELDLSRYEFCPR